MGSCIFAACGLSFDVDEFLKTSNLKPGFIYHKGEAGALDRQPRPDTGFMLSICQDDGEDLQFHFKEALRFLNVNESELKRIRQFGAEDLRMVFSYPVVDMLQHSEFLPPKLVSLIGYLQMGIELTCFKAPQG
jgi:hypothetical protein